MSRADDFRRLLLHASERLMQEDESVTAKFMIAHTATVQDQNEWNRRVRSAGIAKDLASYVAAVTYARVVMEIVAAFLVDDEEIEGNPS